MIRMSSHGGHIGAVDLTENVEMLWVAWQMADVGQKQLADAWVALLKKSSRLEIKYKPISVPAWQP